MYLTLQCIHWNVPLYFKELQKQPFISSGQATNQTPRTKLQMWTVCTSKNTCDYGQFFFVVLDVKFTVSFLSWSTLRFSHNDTKYNFLLHFFLNLTVQMSEWTWDSEAKTPQFTCKWADKRSVISYKVTGDLTLRQCDYNDWMELFADYGVLCPALKVI